MEQEGMNRPDDVMTRQDVSVLLAAYITAVAEAITQNIIEMRAALKILENNGLLKSSEIDQAKSETSTVEREKILLEVQAKVMKSIVTHFPTMFAPDPPVQ